MHGTPGVAQTMGTRRFRSIARISGAVLGGVVAAAAPFVIFGLVAGFDALIEGRFLLFLAIPLVVGAIVVTTSATDPPISLVGAAFGFVMGAAEAGTIMGVNGDSVLAVVITSIVGAVIGLPLGAVGGLVVRGTTGGLTNREMKAPLAWLRPWHVGIAVLILDLVVALAIALVAR